MIIDFNKSSVAAQSKKELSPVLDHGWLKVHKFLAAQPRTMVGLMNIRDLIVLELRGRRRDFVIHRLYRAFNRLRRDLEEQKMYEAA